MESAQGKSSKHQVNLLRRYIRFQEVGLAFFLSSPVAIMVAVMYGFEYLIPQIWVLMWAIGSIIFFIGHVGRQELKEQKERETR